MGGSQPHMSGHLPNAAAVLSEAAFHIASANFTRTLSLDPQQQCEVHLRHGTFRRVLRYMGLQARGVLEWVLQGNCVPDTYVLQRPVPGICECPANRC